MKQGKSVITFAMAAIAVALVIYFGFYVAKVFSEPYTTPWPIPTPPTTAPRPWVFWSGRRPSSPPRRASWT